MYIFLLLAPDDSESLAIMAELRPEAEKLGEEYISICLYLCISVPLLAWVNSM